MITQTRLKELLSYDPITGIFTWNNWARGKRAGCAKKQLRAITVDKEQWGEHKLAYLYMLGDGYVPDLVDHIDGNPLNNIWTNLRPATKQENAFNRKLYSRSNSGVTGVRLTEWNTWKAVIMLSGKTTVLGSFQNKEDAIAARRAAEIKYFGQYAAQFGAQRNISL